MVLQQLSNVTADDRGVQPLVDAGKTKIDFRMVNCEYHHDTRSILMRGRTTNGKSIQVRMTGFQHFFYLQRQTPWCDAAEAKETLERLERMTRTFPVVHIPKQGDAGELEEKRQYWENRGPGDSQITEWAFADGIYKTVYGWTPPQERLQGLLKVWVSNPYFARMLQAMTESEEWLNHTQSMHVLRTYGATTSPELLYRTRYGIKSGAMCRLTLASRDAQHVVYADEYWQCPHDRLCVLPDPLVPTPFRILGWDIEAVGALNAETGELRFSVARWTVLQLMRHIKKTLNFKGVIPKWARNNPAALRTYMRKNHPEVADELPDNLDTDPSMMIACVLTRYGVDHKLEYEKARVLIARHSADAPHVKRPPRHRKLSLEEWESLTPKQHQRLATQYRGLEVVEYDTEAEMLQAFIALRHEWKPDFTTGWNTHQYDLPYLWDRWQYLYRDGGVAAKTTLRSEMPNFGMGIGTHSRAKPKHTNSGASGDKSYLHVSTPFLNHIDALEIWTNASFGDPGRSSHKLDNVAADELVYPGTQVPQRKIEFSFKRSLEFWREGGEKLWFFACYCFVDALLPLQLIDKHDKIGLMLEIGRISYVNLEQVYCNGMQVKIKGMLQKATRERKDGIYIIPDYGRRSLHWPGIFEAPDVRQAVNADLPRFIPRPDGTKGYMGAHVSQPKAGFHVYPVSIYDYMSLYPSTQASYGLCYSTFLTRATIEKYQIPRSHYVRVVLGPSRLIFCGESVHDPALAEDGGYTTPDLKVAYWYFGEETLSAQIIKDLFKTRKDFKRNIRAWKHTQTILSMPRDEIPSLLTDELIQTRVIENLGKEALTEMLDAMRNGLACWQALYDAHLRKIPEGADMQTIVTVGQKQGDSAQLGCKLMANSFYGFTGVSAQKGSFTLMELAASITAICRHIIRLTAYLAERISVTAIQAQLNRLDGDVAPYLAYLKTQLRWRDLHLPVEGPASGAAEAVEEIDVTAAVFSGMLDKAVEVRQPDVDEHMNVIYGDTDSIMAEMAGKCLKGMTKAERIRLTQKLGKILIAVVNGYMLGIENLDDEKIALIMLLTGKKKSYAINRADSPDDEITYTGIEAKRRDVLPLVRDLTKNLVALRLMSADREPEDTRAELVKVLEETGAILREFALGRTPAGQLVMSKQIRRAHYEVKHEAVIAKERRESLGETIPVGDRVPYILVEQDLADEKIRRGILYSKGRYRTKRNIDIADCARYALENNIPIAYEDIFVKKLKQPILKLFRSFLVPVDNYPTDDHLIHEGINPSSERGKKILEKRQDAVIAYQDKVAAPILFRQSEKIFAAKRQIRYRKIRYEEDQRKAGIKTARSSLDLDQSDAKRTCTQTSLHGFFKTSFTKMQRICPGCATIFESTEELCTTCRVTKNAICTQTVREYQTLEQQRAKAYATCRQCVAQTGFPDLEVEKCTKFSCEVYEQRFTLDFTMREVKRRVLTLRTLGAIQDQMLDW